MFEVLHQIAELHGSDLVISEMYKINNNGSNIVGNYRNYKIQHFNNIQALYQLYQERNGIFDTMGKDCEDWIYVCNKLFRSSLFEDLLFDEGRLYEDEFIAHRILYRCKKVTYVPIKLYFYIQREGSIVNSDFNIKKLDRVYALRERARFFKSINQYELFHKAMKCYLEVFFWHYLMAQKEIPLKDLKLKSLKQTLNKSIIHLLKNPYIGLKQKICVLIFVINPRFYHLFTKGAIQMEPMEVKNKMVAYYSLDECMLNLKQNLKKVVEVIPKHTHIYYFDYPVYDNLGDLLIWKGAKSFLMERK